MDRHCDVGQDYYYEPCMCCGEFGHWAQDCPAKYRMNENDQWYNQQRGEPEYQNRQQNYNQSYHPRDLCDRDFQDDWQNRGNQQMGQYGSDDNSYNEKLDTILELMKDIRNGNESINKEIRALSQQVGQLIEEVAIIRRDQGKILSDTHIYPAHKSSNTTSVHINTVHSSLSKIPVVEYHSPQGVEGVVDDITESEGKSKHDQEVKSFTKSESDSNNMFSEISKLNVKVPFPMALLAHKKFGKREPPKGEKWECFEKVKINKPLLETIKENPDHVEFLTELSIHKRRRKLPKQLDLTASVNAVVMGTLPPKLQDPGALIISIQIGDVILDRTLLDLEASVSILPGSLYDQYDFGPLQKVKTTVVLPDQTPTCPRGIVKDVIVKVGDFYYPVDFLVLDCVNNTQPTVILGRPFLSTAKAIINCAEGTVRMRFGEKKMSLKVFTNSFNHKTDKSGSPVKENQAEKKECFVIDRLNEKTTSETQKKVKKKRKRRRKNVKEEMEYDYYKETCAWHDQIWDKVSTEMYEFIEKKEMKHPIRPP